MAVKNKSFWLVYLSLIFLVLLRIIPFLYPASRTWGFNHLLFLSKEFTLIFFVIAAAGLVFPFLKISEGWSEKFINWFSAAFFESPKRFLYRAVFVFMMGSLFVIFAAPTHFLGDGYQVINNIVAESGTFFKWSESGVILLLRMMKTIINIENNESAVIAIQVVSYLSGILSIWLFFCIAEFSSSDKFKRLLIFSASLFSGALLLFFGYAEHYPPLWVAMTGMLYGGLRFLKKGKGLITGSVFLVLGIAFHLQMAIFIPGVIYLTSLRSDSFSSRIQYRRYLFWSLVIIFIGLLGILIYKYVTDLFFQSIVLQLFAGDSNSSQYAAFSLPHLLDMVNEILLISPAFLIFLTGLRKSSISVDSNKQTTLFLSIVSLGCFSFLLLVDPKLGMPRDWDLFSITIYPVTLLSIFLFDKDLLLRLKKLLFPLTIFLIISVLPFLVENLDEASSIKYSEYLISLDFNKSRNALFIESEYFKKKGDTRKADSLKFIYKSAYPRWNKCDSAAYALARGDIDKAGTILGAMKQDLYDAYYQKLMGRLHYFTGDFDKALSYTNNAIRLNSYLASTYGERADIYFVLDSIEKGLNDLRHGYRLDNSNLYILDLLIMTFSEFKQYDSSIYYCYKRLAVDSTFWPTYYELAKAYAHKNDLISAKKYAERMAEFKTGHIGFRSKLEEVNLLIKQQNADY